MRNTKGRIILLAGGLAAAMSIGGLPRGGYLRSALDRVIGRSSARLVSIQELPDVAGDYCERPYPSGQMAGSGGDNLFAAFQETSVHAQDATGPTAVTRPPVRTIQDTFPIYSSIGVDTRLNEVFLQDANTWSVRVFGRDENTPASASAASPKRIGR